VARHSGWPTLIWGRSQPGNIDAELGELVLGSQPRRRDDHQLTVAKLTVLGGQDLAAAEVAIRQLERRNRQLIPGSRLSDRTSFNAKDQVSPALTPSFGTKTTSGCSLSHFFPQRQALHTLAYSLYGEGR
jgi:hypothetical protein